MTLHLASGLERLADTSAESADDLPVEQMRIRARRRRAVQTAATSAVGVAAAAVLAAVAFGLTSGEQPTPPRAVDHGALSPLGAVSIVRVEGSRPVEYTSLGQLAENASAIVVARATGRQTDSPLPDATSGSSPTTFIEMDVERVLSGTLQAEVIEVVSVGDDAHTGEPVLAQDRPFILFIAPAMYAAGRPAGGYAVVGGPAGAYAGAGESFVKVDALSPRMPAELSLDSAWPTITRTEEELLHRGPR